MSYAIKPAEMKACIKNEYIAVFHLNTYEKNICTHENNAFISPLTGIAYCRLQ